MGRNLPTFKSHWLRESSARTAHYTVGITHGSPGLLVHPPPYFLSMAPIRISIVDELLLEYGATNTRELQQDWRRSKAAIENDPVWLEKFHHDPR